jgi:C-terminal processing protease CtpA/Prc
MSGSKKIKIIGLVLFVAAVFATGATVGYFYSKKNHTESAKIAAEQPKDIHAEFIGEIYDKIKENYWEKISDADLSALFKLGAEKLTNNPQVLEPKDKNGVKNMILNIIKNLESLKKKSFVADLSNIVLANLKPFGRSGLYTTRQEQELKDNVQNIDRGANLYAALGVDKNASSKEIEENYQKKTEELKKDKSEEAQKKLAEVNRAYNALSTPEKKQSYDQFGVEPTVISKIIKPNILHLRIKKISPQTFEEFQKETARADKIEALDSLILDLRENIGGAVDILPYFLGPFIGLNQYAYEFFHQGETKPFKTQTGWLPSLVRYKRVVILTDNQTQSSAEIMVATLKKYNAGVVVGTRTKGWGTIEAVFPLENQIDSAERYSLFLVHSLTLRDDSQPIEGMGVDPLIYTADPNWENQLFAYFRDREFIKAIKDIIFK